MKKLLFPLLALAGVTTFVQCKQKPAASDLPTGFTFTVEEDTALKGLPALQSFAMGTHENYWLLLGGRTNGFHGFDSTGQNFPFKKANQFIYVYDTKTHQLDSIGTSVLPPPLRHQYNSTNIEARQIGDNLYLCGGYGVLFPGTGAETWATHGILSRIKVPEIIKAIKVHDSVAVLSAIAYVENDLFRATGGELYKLSDDKFYLVVGHKFMGQYTNDTSVSGAPVQYYLDEVRVFKLTDNGSSLTLGAVQTISDGYPDSTTQYHRRDLVVAPSVLAGGNDYGITVYGGVFTYNTDLPFQYPIYITGGATPTGKVDSSFKQVTNIYSAPNLQLYDKNNDIIYTTIFGGLGDTVNPTAGNFTKLISTLARNNKTSSTTATLNPSGMPYYVGAEGIFLKAAEAPLYNNNAHDIIDFNAIKADGNNHLLGRIYGGIHSNDTTWSDPGNKTHASDKVFKVFIKKQ